MRIVVDAMGSDERPVPDVAGAVGAARLTDDTIVLVGDEMLIRQELTKHQTSDLSLEIVHTDQAIEMKDKPGDVLKEKTRSSLHLGIKMIKDGTGDAFVTAGNTGATHVIATYMLGRIPGIRRSALSAIFPVNMRPVIFLDIGANVDCKPEWLAHFALMGSNYARKALGLEQPCVALLSNGEEEGKGTRLLRDAGTLLRTLPINYIGNVEPKDMLTNSVDVVISDGFTGNIFMKTFEASVRYFTGMIREELRANVVTSLGGLLAKPAFDRVRKRTDTAEIGGAPLLGVNGVVIIGHGGSNAQAVQNAILQAKQAVAGRFIDAIRDDLTRLEAIGD